MKKIIFLLIASIVTLSALHAQKPEVITKNKAGWQKIGDAKVDFKSDKDKFILIGKDKYKSLQIKVKDAPVLIESVQVEYEGDIKEEIELSAALKTGSESRIIELKNSNTEIKNVTFIYRTIPDSDDKKAELELWGLK
jgi:DNA gyrase/topoisomerase IV subunit B